MSEQSPDPVDVDDPPAGPSPSPGNEVDRPAPRGRHAENEPDGNRSRGALAVAVAVTVFALLPVFALILQRWGRPYLPVQDQAVLDLRIRDVWTFSANTPLVGPYSRFGWSHPGPLMYYLLALFSGVTGEPAWASMVGQALLEGVALVWLARLSWKTGGLRRVLPWMAVITLSYVGTGAWILQVLWNPHVAFPFFALFLLQSWLVGMGHTQRLLGLAVVATFLVQTHVGYALPVLVIGVWAVVRLILDRRSQHLPVRQWSVWKAPVIALALLWFIPLVVETAVHFPGNTAHLLKFYAGLDPNNQQPLLGLHNGLGYLATEFRWRPPWLGGSDPVNAFTGAPAPSSLVWLIVPVVLVAVAWWAAHRQHRSDLRILAELLAVSLVAGVVTLTFVRGLPVGYLFYWRIIVGAATVVLSLFVVVDAFAGNLGATEGAERAGSDDRTGRTGRLLTPVFSVVLVAVIAVASIAFTDTVASADGPVSPMGPMATSILGQLHERHQPDSKVIVRFAGSALGGLQAGVIDQLAREGNPVFVDPSLGYQFGYGRTALPSEVGAVWYVTEESQVFSLISAMPGARVLAVSHPLPTGQQAQLIALQRRLAAVLVTEGRADDVSHLGSPLVGFILAGVPGVTTAQLDQLGLLNSGVARGYCLCSVISFPSAQVPAALPAGVS